MTIEHIVPKSQYPRPVGWENLAPACWNCNNTRGDLGMLLFLQLLQVRGRVDQRFIRRFKRTPERKARWRRRAERPDLPPPPRLTYTIGDVAQLAEPQPFKLQDAASSAAVPTNADAAS